MPEYVKMMNMTKEDTMKNIVIIATGGTIAGSGDAGKAAEYEAGRISVSDILESVPSIRSLAHLQTIQMCNIDSNDMNEERWIALRDLINSCAERPDVDGIVVTHGTDTLEETAFFLNLTLSHDLPVVLTGSMRPAPACSPSFPTRSTPDAISAKATATRPMPLRSDISDRWDTCVTIKSAF